DRSERSRRRPGDQGYETECDHRKPEGQPKAVEIGKHIRLALPQRRERAHGPRRRGCRAAGSEAVLQLLQYPRDVGAATFKMLAEIIGVNLLAHAQPGTHYRYADLRTAEPHHLDIGRKRRRP